MAKFDWNQDDYVDERNFEPLPAGRYFLKATNIDEKENSSGTGEILNVEYTVTRGEFKGRKVWHVFNITHKNEQAQRIGRQQINSWSRACGKPNARSTDQLEDIEFEAKITLEKDPKYGEQNRVNGFIIPSDDDKPARRVEREEEPAPAKAKEPAKEPAKETKRIEAPAPEKAKGGERKQANPWD